MVFVRSVKPQDPFLVWLEFEDGVQKVVDLAPLLRGPIFEKIKADPAYFSSVYVDGEAGTIAWDNGADIDPDVLYGNYAPAWLEAEPTPVKK
jgi:hypothetical protein